MWAHQGLGCARPACGALLARALPYQLLISTLSCSRGWANITRLATNINFIPSSFLLVKQSHRGDQNTQPAGLGVGRLRPSPGGISVTAVPHLTIHPSALRGSQVLLWEGRALRKWSGVVTACLEIKLKTTGTDQESKGHQNHHRNGLFFEKLDHWPVLKRAHSQI